MDRTTCSRPLLLIKVARYKEISMPIPQIILTKGKNKGIFHKVVINSE